MPGAITSQSFASQKAWLSWLDKNHAKSSGVWIELSRKGSAVESVSYAEALEVALCYGWIDGQTRGGAEHYWLKRFLPRTPRSIWSKINRKKALELIDAGKMKPAGLAAIEQAKKNGRWEGAYDSVREAVIPEDLAKALAADPKAKAFFAKLDSKNRYAVLHRLQTASKPETRTRRLEKFVAMLHEHKTLHPPLS